MNAGFKKKLAEGNYRVGTHKIRLSKFFHADEKQMHHHPGT